MPARRAVRPAALFVAFVSLFGAACAAADGEPRAEASAAGAAACVDTPPDARFTCAEQAAWGKCAEPFMRGFCAASCGRCPAPTPGAPSVPASDPRLRYTGRIDRSDPARPRFSAPGVHVTMRLRGRGLAVLLEDEHRYGTNRNYFEVVVDGVVASRIRTEPGVSRYQAAEGLADGEHVVTVVKRTEGLVGWTRFLGVEVDGELLAPPPRPARRIELIGDSITAGAGVEAADGSPGCEADGWGQPAENAYVAYGPTLARALRADYVVTAVSGIGLVRNYSSRYDARTMPEVYDLVFTEEEASPRWDVTKDAPDVVVVALGTNDFSIGDSPRPKMTVDRFASAYVRFLARLRSAHPSATLFCVSSPMLGDGYPDPSDTFASDQRTAIARAVAERRAAGDARVHGFVVTKQLGQGCGTHPSAAQQAETAAELGAFIRSTMAW